ncbi:sugar-binding transcriptional regulator [Shouchella clausii]|uniref:sugar-binding transcriptional regulator n=1 Tax=Shouchella clausii TaxID=79880 RepID=UPI0026F907A6|nr:sugar-binding domain-containing protein [Shouchella clausii]MDO7267956.1 sugar-binding domain-containing protein [Shouchella clausii]MDO7287091.1 sugar-binding domain-containing protein [Shouchella clausii]
MRTLINLQRQIVPELMETMAKRYRLLQYIRLMQPIGRRSLATNLQTSERIVRGEVTLLKDQGLIELTTAGMRLTEAGEALFLELADMMAELLGHRRLEEKLKEKLGVSQAIVVAGDSDEEEWVKQELGRACIDELKRVAKKGDVFAVMGGTTLAAVANMVTPDETLATTTFVPARGGLGEKVEIQANTISAEFARRSGASYRLLHVPDQLSEEAYHSLVLERSVREILDVITSSAVVMHGIGDARRMAARRDSGQPFIETLKREEAVAEAFGYYFNANGEIIHKQRTIGLQLGELEGKYVISIAGGHTKANAILAYMKNRPSDVLVTDEGAARRLLSE